jgi:hypothetical protein
LLSSISSSGFTSMFLLGAIVFVSLEVSNPALVWWLY